MMRGIDIVCWLIDMYSSISIFLWKIKIAIIVWILSFYNDKPIKCHPCSILKYTSQDPKIIYARMGCGAEVTSAVRAYYKYDSVISCFTLQLWLKRFGYDCPYIDIYFVKNVHIRASRLNLATGSEIFTVGEEGGSDDISLDIIPSTDIVEFLKSNECINEHSFSSKTD